MAYGSAVHSAAFSQWRQVSMCGICRGAPRQASVATNSPSAGSRRSCHCVDIVLFEPAAGSAALPAAPRKRSRSRPKAMPCPSALSTASLAVHSSRNAALRSGAAAASSMANAPRFLGAEVTLAQFPVPVDVRYAAFDIDARRNAAGNRKQRTITAVRPVESQCDMQGEAKSVGPTIFTVDQHQGFRRLAGQDTLAKQRAQRRPPEFMPIAEPPHVNFIIGQLLSNLCCGLTVRRLHDYMLPDRWLCAQAS